MFVVFVKSLSHVLFFVTPWTAAYHASLSFTISQNFLKLLFIVSVIPSNHLILCHPLLLMPSIFPSIRVFSNSSSHQVAKVSELQLQHQSFKWIFKFYFLSVQFSHSVVYDSLQPHQPQHARPPCPSPTPRVHPNPCPLSWWCHLTISSSVIPFSSCLQSFPASGSFLISWLFASGD